ncbi:MAG: YkgJ family cysteine cluster protein [Promethearchaeota archaeon]
MPTTKLSIAKALEKGVRFQCKYCGRCCKGFDEGEVYLYFEDIKRLSDELGLKGEKGLKQFAKKYLKITSNTFFWKEEDKDLGKNYSVPTLGFKFEGDDEHCEFLAPDNKCIIYPAAPFQCKSFPFWQMMVSSPKNLKEYSKKCPGLRDHENGEIKLYTKEEMYELAKKEQEMEIEYFLKMEENDFDIFKVFPWLPRDLPTDEDLKKESKS